MKKFIIILITITPFICVIAQGTLQVPSEYSTIQLAINASTDGDIVLIAPGTYYENINFIGKAITVASHFLTTGNATHINNTIIDGSQPSNPNIGSVVSFRSGEDTTSVLYGLTIKGGTGTYHSITNVRVGGGIVALESGAKICYNIIEHNSSTHTYAYGGGIFISSNDKCTNIKSNIIRNNLLQGNFPFGGGISLQLCGKTFIESNIIIDNVVNGIMASGGGLDVVYCTDDILICGNYIKGNNAQLDGYGGGGIDLYDLNSQILVNNNLILENAGFRGGGILVDNTGERSSKSASQNYSSRFKNNPIATDSQREIPSLINNTIINNTAVSGGGIYCFDFTPTIKNSIIWGNQPSQITGDQAEIEYSDIQGGYTGIGNIELEPQIDLNSEYCVLLASSPCIDAGNPDPIYNDIENLLYPGSAMWPAQGGLRNDMGHCGGPASPWYLWGWPMPVEDASTVLSEYILMQNYPNPFNPTTTIKYRIPEQSLATLKVYDVLGGEIETLVNEEKQTGTYEINLYIKHLPSGVYFYRLQAGDFVETRKMILMK